MSSREANLTRYRNEVQPNGGRHAGEKYLCGDMNTSILRTELGRTILLQHNVVSPRPYSRINSLQGTKGILDDCPPRLALDHPEVHGLNAKRAHAWLDERDMAKMREAFTHPLWAKLVTRAAGSTHGGMDFVMNWRHLDCLRRGVPLDSDVYDAAEWICIVELSTRSVATGSMPVKFPDFTRGQWKTRKPIDIAEATVQPT